MDFEEWMKIENRYQDVLNSTTEPTQNAFFELSNYKEKRDAYYCRLKKEKEEFNSAIAQIKHDRLLEHKNLKACIIWSIITIAFMVCIDFGIPIGFKSFFEMSSVGKIPFIISITVSV